MDSKIEWWSRLAVHQPKSPPVDDPLAQELCQEDETTRKWIARYLYLADFLLSSQGSEQIEEGESSAA